MEVLVANDAVFFSAYCGEVILLNALSEILDLLQVTCPGTFLRDYGYVYLKVNCMGLEVNTKSVPPTFPLFFHERLRFERVSLFSIYAFHSENNLKFILSLSATAGV